jgi:hypothetical protein
MGSWYILPAHPEDKALLESTPSAAVGKQTDGQGRGAALYFFAYPELLKALNSGVRGQRPREILHRRLIPQAAVRPLLIVVAPPSFDLLLSILQARKPVFIQAFLPKTAVKGRNEGIIRGLPWRPSPHHLVFVPPFCYLPVLLGHVLSPNPVSQKTGSTSKLAPGISAYTGNRVVVYLGHRHRSSTPRKKGKLSLGQINPDGGILIFALTGSSLFANRSLSKRVNLDRGYD